MAAAQPSVRVQAPADFHAAHQALLRGFSATVYKKDSTAWRQWHKFYEWLGIPADLQGIGDPIPFLPIFAERMRAGLLSDSGIPIKKRLVEQYLRSTRQIFTAVGARDLHHKKLSQIDFWLGRKLATYAKQDPPLTRVRPIPVSVLQAIDATYQGGTTRQKASSDLSWIALFFLLRPGEYCRGGADSDHYIFLL